jgi:hypothetical protein
MDMVREAKRPEEDVVEASSGAWGYDVDSKDFVMKLRRSKRLDNLCKNWKLVIFFMITIFILIQLKCKYVSIYVSGHRSIESLNRFFVIFFPCLLFMFVNK